MIPQTEAPVFREHFARDRQANVMLSRVAGSLYWMSRYLERAENIARLLDVNLQLLLDFEKLDDESLKQHWLPILHAIGDETLFFQLYETADSLSVSDFITFNRNNPNSLFNCLVTARENARQVRDQISAEMWTVLNDAYHFISSRCIEDVWDGDVGAFYDQIKQFSHLFQGITVSTFARNEGYEFIQFGKYLERADKTSRLLDVKYHILLPKVTDVGGAVDAAQWQAVLRSTSALEAYRRFYVTDILASKVAQFLIFQDAFPRSITFCVDQLRQFALLISEGREGESESPPMRKFGRFASGLRFLAVDDVIQQGLHEFVTEVQTELAGLAAHIYQTYMYCAPVDMDAEIRFHQQQEQQQQGMLPAVVAG
ncbi:MAG: alpha-E domain-containing protein [Verrucomicrobiales bacterium]|nr:alpha-E domain-containing protein [Verrucomicrobiales bacterium]